MKRKRDQHNTTLGRVWRIMTVALVVGTCQARLKTAVVLPHGDFVLAPQLVENRCICTEVRASLPACCFHSEFELTSFCVSKEMGRVSCTQQRRCPSIACECTPILSDQIRLCLSFHLRRPSVVTFQEPSTPSS